MLKTLVITSCTGEKIFHPDNQLVHEDFLDSERLAKREAELSEYKTPAGKMYTGMQHLRLMEGISELRKVFGDEIIDLYIVSAGYGLISEEREVVPYEVTFNTMNSAAISNWSTQLKIHKDLNELIPKYDLVFFLLGDKYLKAINLPLESPRDDQKLLLLASGTSRKKIPSNPPYFFIEVGQEDAKSFSYGLVGLKGYLFKLLSQEMISSKGVLFEKIFNDPSLLMETLDKHRKKVEPQPVQLSLFSEEELAAMKKKEKKTVKKGLDFYLPESEYAKNYTGHMRYFIPEWDDRVDPKYDFINDFSEPGRNTYKDDVYAHEIYPTPNYDGILMSKVIVESNKKKKALIEQMGVHEFIRFDKTRPVMGDCGAFDYIDEYNPPFQTDEILDYYERLG